MVDAEKFGEAMGDLVREAIAPLNARIKELESSLYDLQSEVNAQRECAGLFSKETPPANEFDIEAVKALVDEAVKQIPAPKDGAKGADGTNGAEGKQGEPGQKGADGLGLAGAMIDRDGALQITLTNGEVKSLGVIVGKDGKDGTNGSDGIGFDSFDLEYIEETHEVCVKASCAGRTKELRYPAGGIRPAGYWREGAKAKAGDAWVHDGSLWIATKATSAKPATGDDWIIAARKGRDGERGQKGSDAIPPAPVKLKA